MGFKIVIFIKLHQLLPYNINYIKYQQYSLFPQIKIQTYLSSVSSNSAEENLVKFYAYSIFY